MGLLINFVDLLVEGFRFSKEKLLSMRCGEFVEVFKRFIVKNILFVKESCMYLFVGEFLMRRIFVEFVGDIF